MYPFMNVHVTTKKVYNLESGLSIETTIYKNTRYDFIFPNCFCPLQLWPCTDLKIGSWICGRGLGVMTIMPSGFQIRVVYDAPMYELWPHWDFELGFLKVWRGA
jgi:hypothetical protein